MTLLPLLIALPLLAGFVFAMFPSKSRRLPDLLAFLVMAFLCFGAATLFNAADQTYSIGGQTPVLGISLVLDGISKLLLVIANGVALLVVIYSVAYMDTFTSRGRFYSLFFLMITGLNGVILTGDLFNQFVFLEVASIASYALVAFSCKSEGLEAAFKYLVLGTIASLFLLFGIGLFYAQFGTTNIGLLSQNINGAAPSGILVLGVVMLIAGFALKAALVPFHAWLPDAHSVAPSPISAMLSGVLIKILGVYALSRVLFTIMGMTSGSPLAKVVMALGVLSMVVGGLLALGQSDFKRMLGWSSISQIGFIILALGLATPLGIIAGIFHLVCHASFKSLMFLNSGCIEHSTGTVDMRELGGLGKRMRVTGATSFIGAMSIAGMPPFGGFFSKLLIIWACVDAGRYWLAVIAVAVSFLTLGYFAKMLKDTFFGEPRGKAVGAHEAPVLMLIPTIFLALMCVLTSVFYFNGPVPFISNPRQQLLAPAADSLKMRKSYVRLAVGEAPVPVEETKEQPK